MWDVERKGKKKKKKRNSRGNTRAEEEEEEGGGVAPWPCCLWRTCAGAGTPDRNCSQGEPILEQRVSVRGKERQRETIKSPCSLCHLLPLQRDGV